MTVVLAKGISMARQSRIKSWRSRRVHHRAKGILSEVVGRLVGDEPMDLPLLLGAQSALLSPLPPLFLRFFRVFSG